MTTRVGFVWDEAFAAYDFGPQHPLQPVRVLMTVELSRACGILDLPVLTHLAPRAATRAELESVHDPEYVEAIHEISRTATGPFGSYGWGVGISDNPAFRGMHDASALVCGGQVVAAEAIWSGAVDHAFNPAGGLHHAMPDRAAGFCIYNDPAVAIRWLLDNGAARVAYVDVDVHHGDGVQEIFYSDPRVLTISLHESGQFLFPGTGFADEIGAGDAAGTAVNVPLPPFTDDDAYARAFDRVVPPLIEAFRPDVLVTQLGCDTHATDPLAHFALTTRTYRRLARALHGLAHDHCGGRWLATGGGGYQLFSVVPRAWTIYFAELARAELPDRLPQEWLGLARARGATDLPMSFEDPPVTLPDARRAEVDEAARASADDTIARVFQHYGLTGGTARP